MEARAVLDKLATLREPRERFGALARRLVGDLLARFPPAATGPIVEIGAGDGQLAGWLPAAFRDRLVHTEPLREATRRIREALPGATVWTAAAERLPLRDHAAAAVLGLCVLDVVADGAAVVRELGRVLRPDGVFLHLLDMSPTRAFALADLVKAGMVGLPNVFSNPSAAPWPEDIFAVPRGDLERILDILGDDAGGLPLRTYRDLFLPTDFSPASAAAAFDALDGDPEARRALREVFQIAHRRASPEDRRVLAASRGVPLSSARHLDGRVRAWFEADERLQILFSGIVTGSEVVPGSDHEGCRYRSLAVGHLRCFPDVPPAVRDATAPSVEPGHLLQELSLYVVVARSTPGSPGQSA